MKFVLIIRFRLHDYSTAITDTTLEEVKYAVGIITSRNSNLYSN